LSETIQAIRELGESLQDKYPEVIVSVPDILILAATVAGELLRDGSLWGTIPFRPGRKLYNISDLGVSKADTVEACMEIANRLPSPAYMRKAKALYASREELGNMLSTDLII